MGGVDVVVPCYNYAHLLRECVGSILQQERVDVRVLIIDDASSDDSQQVGERLSAEDSRVQYRRHETNKGHIATYNEGLLGWAAAEYSVLLSADDALAPGALARATKLMDNQKDVGMSYGMALIIGHDDRAPYGTDPLEESKVLSGAHFLGYCCATGNPVPTPTAVVRTNLQHQLGGYRKDLPHAGDMEMWMRFAAHAPIGVLRAVQGYYRWHNRNMSSVVYADLIRDQQERLLACTEVLGRWGQSFPESQKWLVTARERLGSEAFWLASRAFDAGDVEGSARCLGFAVDTHPGIRTSNAWANFRWKRLIGSRSWHRLRPLIDLLRGRRAQRADGDTGSRFYAGQVNGWWPESV